MNKDNARDYLPLVQALAEGRVIQYQYKRADCSSDWMDIESDVSFDQPAERYRIKPEPREIWVNEYKDRPSSIHPTEAYARMNAMSYAITRRYREVLE